VETPRWELDRRPSRGGRGGRRIGQRGLPGHLRQRRGRRLMAPRVRHIAIPITPWKV